MLELSPIVIGAMSPRTTELYQMLAFSPNETSPRTCAPGAINAVGCITGVLAGLRLDLNLRPRGDGLAVLLRGIEMHPLHELDRREREQRIGGILLAADVPHGPIG